MVPPIKSWRVENQLVITFVRLTIVIYYKLIALTLLHEILVYWLFYQTDISSYLQFVWWYSSVPVLVLSKNILLTATIIFFKNKRSNKFDPSGKNRKKSRIVTESERDIHIWPKIKPVHQKQMLIKNKALMQMAPRISPLTSGTMTLVVVWICLGLRYLHCLWWSVL